MDLAKQRIRRLRESILLTQAEFGKLIGANEMTIRNYESKGPKLRDSVLLKLKNVGINPLYLFGSDSFLLPGFSIVNVQDAVREIVEQVEAA
jgi:transcriptional regulator with XRE-family HTH domain